MSAILICSVAAASASANTSAAMRRTRRARDGGARAAAAGRVLRGGHGGECSGVSPVDSGVVFGGGVHIVVIARRRREASLAVARGVAFTTNFDRNLSSSFWD